MVRRVAYLASCLLAAAPALAQLHATTGGGGTDSRSLLALNATSGAATLIGTPDFGTPGEPILLGLPGADFAPDGSLFVVTSDSSLDNSLARINPATGALIQVVGLLSPPDSLDVRDIAIHPQTGVIYASATLGPAPLYSIDPGTALVTTIGGTDIWGPLAFLNDGTLYMAQMNPQLPAGLYTVDTGTGALTPVAPLTHYYMGLGRGPDGMLYGADFEGNKQWGDAGGTFGDIYRIHPITGQETYVGSNPNVIIHDIAFLPPPEPTIPTLSGIGLALLSLGLLALALSRLRLRRLA